MEQGAEPLLSCSEPEVTLMQMNTVDLTPKLALLVANTPFQNIIAGEIISDVTQARMFTDEVMSCHVIVYNRFIPFTRGQGDCCWSQSQLSLGEGRVNPEQVGSSSQGPH